MFQNELHGLRRFLISRVDQVISVSRGAVAAWWHRAPAWWKRFLQRRLIVIHDGRDMARLGALPRERSFVRDLGVPDDAPVVGMLGALAANKRQDLFLRAARMVLDRRPDAWFVLVGAPYLGAGEQAYADSLRSLAADLSLSERAVFTGYRDDAYRILQNLDIIVVPSRREALGGVLIEALAAGVPAVASNVDGTPEVVADGVTGLLIASDEPKDYAEKILSLLNDPEQRRRMSSASLARARQFDQGALTRRLENLYRSLATQLSAQ